MRARVLPWLAVAGALALARPGFAVPQRRPTARPRASRAYLDNVKRWHAAPSAEAPAPTTPEGWPLLVLDVLNTGERVALAPSRADGGFPASELDRAAHALRDTRAGNEYPVDPRLLDLAYGIARHFATSELRVISGYRTPAKGGRSFHGRGRAMDMIVPGATDDQVAAWARTLGFVGVGLYPTSGFVHVDSRPRSYFWLDASGPGQRNRGVGVLGAVATEGDRRALERGDHAPPAWAPPAAAVEPVDAHATSGDTRDDEADDDDGHPTGGE